MKASKCRLRRVSGWRRLLPTLMLVAFTLQSFVTQTHIHFTPDALTRLTEYVDSDSGKIAHQYVGQNEHGTRKTNDDPADCPLCQEILYSGYYVAPGTPSVPPPAHLVTATASVGLELPFVSATSHIWQGRGPPLI